MLSDAKVAPYPPAGGYQTNLSIGANRRELIEISGNEGGPPGSWNTPHMVERLLPRTGSHKGQQIPGRVGTTNEGTITVKEGEWELTGIEPPGEPYDQTLPPCVGGIVNGTDDKPGWTGTYRPPKTLSRRFLGNNPITLYLRPRGHRDGPGYSVTGPLRLMTANHGCRWQGRPGGR